MVQVERLPVISTETAERNQAFLQAIGNTQLPIKRGRKPASRHEQLLKNPTRALVIQFVANAALVEGDVHLQAQTVDVIRALSESFAGEATNSRKALVGELAQIYQGVSTLNDPFDIKVLAADMLHPGRRPHQ